MTRGLFVWKLKLCLAAAAAVLASAMAPERAAHEQLVKEKNVKPQMTVDTRDAKPSVPTKARQPAPTDSRDRLSAMM